MKRDREALSGEPLSPADLASLFKKHDFKAAKGQEEISETFIQNALFIWNRAICHAEVVSRVLMVVYPYPTC